MRRDESSRRFLLDFSPAIDARLQELTRDWNGAVFERLERGAAPAALLDAAARRRPEFA